MYSLIQFLSKQRLLLLFLALECWNLWSVFTYNDYQHSLYFNTNNALAASWLEKVNAVKSYHQLLEVNGALAKENASLRSALYEARQRKGPEGPLPYFVSKVTAQRFQMTPAKVVDLSTTFSQNYFTIDKGRLDGIQPGMAVISPYGVVGKVLESSAHLSIVISLLHTQNTISAKVKRNGELGFVKWKGYQSEVANMNDVSKYKQVLKGDTIVTSDFNAVFPPNIPIGVVAKMGLSSDGNFHDIQVLLLTKFNQLHYVYVVKNQLAAEHRWLEQAKPKPEE